MSYPRQLNAKILVENKYLDLERWMKLMQHLWWQVLCCLVSRPCMVTGREGKTLVNSSANSLMHLLVH